MWKKIGIAGALIACVSFVYWSYAVRPFLWIYGASVKMTAVPVISECSGKILDLSTQEGSIVAKGAPLCALSTDLLEVKRIQAQSAVEGSRVNLNRQKAALDQAMQLYLALRSDMELKKASQKAVDRQMARLQEAQINYDEAKCQNAATEAELAYVTSQLGKTALSAPEESLVLQRCRQTGEIVKEGDTLYVLGDINQAWIEAHLPESQLSHIALGSDVRIEMKAYPETLWKGKIVSVGPSLLPAQPGQEKMVVLKISLEPNAMNLNLKEGLTADIRLKL